MNRNLLTIFLTAVLSLFASVTLAIGQGPSGGTKTNSKILYHNGPVRTGIQDVYFIFYGCWQTPQCRPSDGDWATMTILMNFTASVGNSPYMFINSTYTDSTGQPANPAIVFGGWVVDNAYRHGFDLTQSDIAAIVNDHIGDPGGQGDLPSDPQGIYVVVASADVASTETGFCTPGAQPFHDFYYVFNSSPTPYIFLGNVNRCPSVVQYLAPGGKTPNGNFAADVMVSRLAHALNGTLTNPYGNAWYDRYGLENADKCAASFGTTYTTANGALANIHLAGNLDYLIEENWVNDRKGRCAMYQ